MLIVVLNQGFEIQQKYIFCVKNNHYSDLIGYLQTPKIINNYIIHYEN